MKIIKVGIDPMDLIDGPADGSVSKAIDQLPEHLQNRRGWADHYDSYLVLEPKEDRQHPDANQAKPVLHVEPDRFLKGEKQ